MLAIWIISAVLLYFPFKKWGATADAPLIAALLWPVALGIMLIGIFITLVTAPFNRD